MGNMVVSVSTNLSKPCGEVGGSGTEANDSVDAHFCVPRLCCCLRHMATDRRRVDLRCEAASLRLLRSDAEPANMYVPCQISGRRSAQVTEIVPHNGAVADLRPAKQRTRIMVAPQTGHWRGCRCVAPQRLLLASDLPHLPGAAAAAELHGGVHAASRTHEAQHSKPAVT